MGRRPRCRPASRGVPDTRAPQGRDRRDYPDARPARAASRITSLAAVAAERHDPFRVLIACLLSLRTKDETTGPASARLFVLADAPAAMLRLTPKQIEHAIFPVGFSRTKARVILGVCRDLIDRFGGRVPDDIDELLTLKGVGRKPANLVVTQGFNKLWHRLREARRRPGV